LVLLILFDSRRVVIQLFTCYLERRILSAGGPAIGLEHP